MRFFSVLCVVISAFAAESAYADVVLNADCNAGPEYYKKACTDAKKARRDLNRQWNIAVTVARNKDQRIRSGQESEPNFDTGYYQGLLATERRWIVYRETQCDFWEYLNRQAQGSGLSAIRLSCMAAIESDRAAELKEISDWIGGN